MFAACFGRAHAGGHALADERGLQFSHRTDDGEHRPAHRAIGVDLILDADKSHAEVVELLKRRQQVARAEATLILQAVSWYLRYPLSYRDIEELFLERGLEVDHSTLNRWVLGAHPGALRHQTSPAGDRERPLPGQTAHAAGGLLPGLPHGPADHPGLRSHAGAAQGFRLCRRVDCPRAEPAARALLRSSRG